MANVKGIKERLHYPLFDAVYIRGPRVQPDGFYVNAPDARHSVGQQLALRAGVLRFFVDIQDKTVLDTNMLASGVLPHFNTMEVRSLRVALHGGYRAQPFACAPALDLPPPPPPPPPELRLIDFNTNGAGTPLRAGLRLGGQLAAVGIANISAVNFRTDGPQLAILFDSSNPSGGDIDLGTPNETFGGPGIGPGGERGTPGENSTPVGNVVIIAENDVDANGDGLIDDPDDDRFGGILRFDLTGPHTVEYLDIIDVEPASTGGGGQVRLTLTSGLSAIKPMAGFGDNSFERVFLNQSDVIRIEVETGRAGAVSAIAMRRQVVAPPPVTGGGPSRVCPAPVPDFARVADVILRQSVLSFIVGEKTMIQHPTWYFPTGAGLTAMPGSEAFAGPSPSLAFATPSNGEPDVEAAFRFAEPVFIEKQQPFRVEIEFPETAPIERLKGTFGPLRIWVILDGFLTRDVQ